LLRKPHETLTSLSCGHVEVFLPHPPKQPHALSEDGVALQIVRRDGLGGDELGGECTGGGQRGAEAEAKTQDTRHGDSTIRRHDDTTTRRHNDSATRRRHEDLGQNIADTGMFSRVGRRKVGYPKRIERYQ
jgi:hypothetical protein